MFQNLLNERYQVKGLIQYGIHRATGHKNKLILLWFGLQNESFLSCREKRCVTTIDRRMANISDAILFWGFRIRNKTEFLQSLPKSRSPNQVWIYNNGESQTRSLNGNHITFLNNLFNITHTFLQSSDLPVPYGYFVKKKRIRKDYTPPDFIKKRSKIVAWLVSHCGPPSRRQVYFAELKKHIQADAFGRCNHTAKCPEGKGKDCLKHISQHYKFYFAAENSLCKDYITEKLFHNAYKYGMVPIVYGGANYSAFLPPNSYIDVKDFSTPKELGRYLRFLNENDSIYNEYFKWKSEYKLKQKGMAYCNVCEYLHKHPEPNPSHTDMHIFWNEKDCLSTDSYLNSIMSG